MALELNGTTGVQGNSGAFVSGTAVASTSGTSIDFTSIPSWVKRITVSCQGVSTNGTSLGLFQLRTSGGAETSGYVGYGIQQISNSSGLRSYTEGFAFGNGTASTAASTRNGVGVFTLLTGNTWAFQGQWADTTGNSVIVQAAGTKSLSAALTGVRITTVNGTDTFDAGTINILYE
jgi:hypothetical protein